MVGEALAHDTFQHGVAALGVSHAKRDAIVIAELELVQVRLHVLLADADVGAVDPALHEVPEALDVAGRLTVDLQLTGNPGRRRVAG